MILENLQMFSPRGALQPGRLAIRKGRIQSPAPTEPGETVLDAGGALALPGLVDIHLHGAAGYDFCDADETGLQRMADWEARHGVLTLCPTTMSLPESTLRPALERLAAHRNGRGADFVGIHLEGPFLNPKGAGAQNTAFLCLPDVALFHRLQQYGNGHIRLLDLAPELPGALDFLQMCAGEAGFGLAHTRAGYDTTCSAFAAGASRLTHLYNAMPGMHHRSPGPIPAALENNAWCELIADGEHVHPAMVRLAFRLFGEKNIVLISDSMRACGLPNGTYTLGGHDVCVQGTRAALARHPETLAGSVSCLYDCLLLAVRMGIPLYTAVQAATKNPANTLGVGSDYGSLESGHFGNVLLTDPELHLLMVIRQGKILFPDRDSLPAGMRFRSGRREEVFPLPGTAL